MIRSPFLLLSLLAVLLFHSCGTTKKGLAPSKSFADTWQVSVSNTPLGNVEGILQLAQTAEGYTGVFKTQGQDFPLKNIAVAETSLQAAFYFAQYDLDVSIKLEGSPTADSLKGWTMSEYPTTATRKME